MSFTLIETRHIPELDSEASLYRHDGTGARLLSVSNKDENKSFGISFRTPPSRSDGIAHILEHSVLCGSKKYPVKEPFVELMKGSLNTFLNALTYPDKTVYPVASTNVKDFYNLIDVYMDAVLNPRLTEDTFRQEGWHWEIDPDTGKLGRKGVVYNEMKGAYSDPDDLHDDLCRRSLFPDTAYGLDSGGDPAVIPSLDHATFKAFHERYYHPSNSFIFFYGDDEPDKRLAFIDAWLAPFSRIEVDSLPGLQAAFPAPVRKTALCEGNEAKAWTAVNWATTGHGDQKTSLGLAILSHILTATPASPLRKALIDSGLGEDLAGFGLEDGLRMGAYSVGLKGVAPADVDRVEALVLEVLGSLAEHGIDRSTVQASLNTVEFALREKNTGRFPRGLAVMLEALNEWLYDENPLNALSFSAALEDIKREALAASGPGYFEVLIRRYLLENPHRSTVTVITDPAEALRREEAEKAELARIQSGFSEEELRRIGEEAERLRELQETPDSPEALATIPSLSLEDLSKESIRIPAEQGTMEKAKLLYHDLPTSSILYLDLAFDLEGLDERLLPYVGLFGRVLLEMGAGPLDFVALSQQIGTHTGGIWTSSLFTTKWRKADAASAFVVRAKALESKVPELLKLLGLVLREARLDNKDRFRQIVLEEKAQAESSLVPSGHRLVMQRLQSRLTEADRRAEIVHGLSQLFFLRTLAERLDNDWEGVRADLESLRNFVVDASLMTVNVTIDRKDFDALRPALAEFAAGLPAGTRAIQPHAEQNADGVSGRRAAADMELLTLPTQVNFVGMAYPLGNRDADALSGAFLVVKKYLDTTFLWEKVRVQGGAYGGFSSYDINSGIFILLSYRDPNLEKTLEIFEQTASYLEGLDISREELVRSIIGTIGSVDGYQLPDAKGFTSLVHSLIGYRYEDRQAMRDQILAASEADFRRLAALITQAAPKAIRGAVSSAQKVQALPEQLKSGAEIIAVM
jgi:Zn-dependent M16 (insulinase) family peptidase